MRTLLKRWWFWGAATLLVAGLVSRAWIGVVQGPINKANFDRIEIGMTRAEVEALLGGPPGNYSVFVVAHGMGTRGMLLFGSSLVGIRIGEEDWVGDQGCISVLFDDAGKVSYKKFSPPERCTTQLPAKDQIDYTMRRLRQKLTGTWPADPWE